MPRLTDCIALSNELKQVPISILVENAKSFVKERGYPQSTIWHFNERFNDLQKSAALFGTEKLSEEFISKHIKVGMQKKPKATCSSVQRKSLLNLIAAAANSTPVFTYEREADKIQTNVLRENLASYGQHLNEQGKRKETIKSYLQTATKLMLYLDRLKKTISEVSAIDIRNFITEFSTKWSPRSMRTVPSQLKTYLKFAGADTDVILFSSFHVPRKSKPVRAMSNENAEALWKYIESNDGDLRSKAIATIFLTTGMRPVDIAGLMLEDIDWNNDTISFVQSKTDEHMNVNLFPVMGSAITRYITEQRPKGTGVNTVFLSKNAPYRKLTPAACSQVFKAALKKAGITVAADGLHCPRAARRSLVSRMIAKGIPIQKAAAAIGHVDEKSIDLYTELDVEK